MFMWEEQLAVTQQVLKFRLGHAGVGRTSSGTTEMEEQVVQGQVVLQEQALHRIDLGLVICQVAHADLGPCGLQCVVHLIPTRQGNKAKRRR